MMTDPRPRRSRVALILALTALCLGCFAGVARADFGVHSFSASLLQLERQLEGEETLAPGTPQLTAGAHPDFTTTLELNVKTVEGTIRGTGEVPDGNVKSVLGYGPPGLVGNPTVVPKCSFSELEGTGPAALCPPETQVGRLGAILYTAASRFEQKFPVYALNPPPGVVAEFGVNISGDLVLIDGKLVDRDGVYSVALQARNISEGLPVGGFRLTLWGVPASPVHDAVRGGSGEPTKSAAPQLPFVSNPTSCPGTPLQFSTLAGSWQGASVASPTISSDEEGRPMTIEGCQNVPFEASFSAQPTTSSAESPSGLKTVIKVPQTTTPNGISTADLRDAVIRLPEGMSVNPASANGLESCTAAQADLDGEAAATCPAASKLGTVEIESPLLEAPLDGSVYLARQGENKFGSLLAIYLAVDDPRTGIVLKLPGKIETGPGGQVTASFTENPQLPFETLTVELFGGDRAPLMTPPSCGTYTADATFTPWSGTAALERSSSFQVTSGPGGSACPAGGFDPGFSAGTVNPVAGQYSPFVLDLSRADGTQRLATISTTLPAGLLGKLAGVPYCPAATLAGIPTAEGSAAAQVAAPSCPAASSVGTVSVGAGAGQFPFYVDTGKVYLAGPYAGAPLSLAIVTPALAGPFDLGNVTTRVALEVNATTARITAVADPLPTVLHGIPLDLRDVVVDLDRPQFTINPTSCRPAAIAASIGGVAGSVVARSARFQVADCGALGFRPTLALSVKGQTGRTGDPALTATLKAPAGEANIAKTQVILPRSMFIDQAHVNSPCTRVQFDEGRCPASSVLGTATAWSPLLAEPLTGPVYFRSNGGERKLPDLVADLNGQIHVTLVGFIDSVKGGGESSRVRTRFQSVPDAPVSKFVLKLKGGKVGLIENSQDLCRAPQVATIDTEGQNGKVHDFGDRIAARCGKRK